MTSRSIQELKEKIHAWASGLDYGVRVYLFGSRLKDPVREESDLDIAIEFLKPLDFNPETLWLEVDEEWRDYLSQVTGLSVDLQLYVGDRTAFLKSKLAEGSVIIFDAEQTP